MSGGSGVGMGEVGAAYEGCRRRIASITAHLDDHSASMAVPACPQWCVKDVVAHLTGVVDDVLAGRIEGVATDPWTSAQVEERRTRPISTILAEWEELAPAFEALLDSAGPRGRQAVADVVTHEHDIRGALGEEGFMDTDAVRIGLEFVAGAFAAAAAQQGLSVRVCVVDGPGFGAKEADAVLTAEAFTLLRALTGRRSEEQLSKMHWTGSSPPVMTVFTFGPFHPPEQQVHY